MISEMMIISFTSFLVFVLFCLYIYLVVIKTTNNRYARKKQAWLTEHQEEIQAYLIHGDLEQVSFVPTKSHQFSALEDFFSVYLMNYKIDKNGSPIKKFIEHYFLAEYRKRLNDRKWGVRMNTLYFFDLFKLDVIQDDILQHLKRPNLSKEEEYQIFILLASLEYDNCYEVFKESKGLPPFLLNVILNRLVDENNLSEYLEMFEELDQSWQIGLLDLIRNKNLRSLEIITFLENLLNTEASELRIRALKTVAHIGYLSSPEVIISWFETNSQRENWKSDETTGERLMAARLFGMIKDEQFIQFLEELISDQKFMVRTEAAKAFRKYKNGKERLLIIVNNHSDKYSRNIALEWLERSLDYE
ncbi:HEAT repeat domain-containing protein [Bacillaceae bacterium IKA-2]|nr:HEAT repeat domain-containing protein [Bacillaceae bacterium IKA-2]